MQWQLKSAIQRAIGALPRSHDLNFALQRYVTRSLPPTDARLAETAESVAWLRTMAEEHTTRPAADQHWIEFGAGWHLATAMSLAAGGVGHQSLFDLFPTARPSLVHAVGDRLADLGVAVELGGGPSVNDLVKPLGIDYRAPSDARSTGLPPGSVDVIHSTSVLEHVPMADLDAMLVEFARVLRPDGICAFQIDYHDHWAASDGRIDGTHFLRYSEKEWSRWNCGLQYQNRRRHGDYVDAFRRRGLALVVEEPIVDETLPPDPIVHAEFAGRDDLRVGDGRFVLRRGRLGP